MSWPTALLQMLRIKKWSWGIIGDEAGRMNRLLKEMLELSRMESGRMQLNLSPLSVKEELRAFIEKYDGYIAEKALNVSLYLAEEEDRGLIDPMRFEQIMGELSFQRR